MSPQTEHGEAEKDLKKVIQPDDVSNNRDLKNYYRQRLGNDFDDLAFILMDRDSYLGLLHGEHALLSKMIMEDEAAADEIFLAYAGDKLNRVVMTFNIESPTVGNRALEFIRKNKTCAEHDTWLAQMEQLSYKMQKLHHQWKKQPFPYYKLVSKTQFKEQK